MNRKLTMILVASLLSACGGTDCPDTNTRTKITTDEGSYWIVCSSFQCPGYPRQTRCWVE
jgi:major membrane immunogen (membrane-anchored lipoprotein)